MRKRRRPGLVDLSGFERPKAAEYDGEPREWFKIVENKAKGGGDTSATVYIYDEIGFYGVTAAGFVSSLDALKAKQITFRINSPGGEVYDGLAIYNAIRNHPAQTIAIVDGLAASAASFIAMAADELVMQPTGEMMIHDAMGLCFGNAAEMRRMLDMLDRMSDNIAGIYASRAGGDTASWRGLMQAETWYSAQAAVNAGLADRIDDQAVPGEAERKPNAPAGVEVGPKAEWRGLFAFSGFEDWRARKVVDYDPLQPRQDDGKWTSGGGAVIKGIEGLAESAFQHLDDYGTSYTPYDETGLPNGLRVVSMTNGEELQLAVDRDGEGGSTRAVLLDMTEHDAFSMQYAISGLLSFGDESDAREVRNSTGELLGSVSTDGDEVVLRLGHDESVTVTMDGDEAQALADAFDEQRVRLTQAYDELYARTWVQIQGMLAERADERVDSWKSFMDTLIANTADESARDDVAARAGGSILTFQEEA